MSHFRSLISMWNVVRSDIRDIKLSFVENSLWFPGSLGCVSCHNGDLTDAKLPAWI